MASNFLVNITKHYGIENMTEQESYWDYMKRMYKEHDSSQLPEGRVPYEEWLKTKRYAVVTAVSSHRMRYVVPLDQLQAMNPDKEVEPEWLADAVTMQEVEDFSQEWLGEQIIDVNVVSEDKMLEMFDKDNPYLEEWTKEKKISWVRKLIRMVNDDDCV